MEYAGEEGCSGKAGGAHPQGFSGGAAVPAQSIHNLPELLSTTRCFVDELLSEARQDGAPMSSIEK